MDNRPNLRLQNRYRLLRPLGEGGMAEVWLARDELMDRHVAIKRLRPQYAQDAALLHRFQREAQLVAQLDSPHIVQVYDVDFSPDGRFIVMEYVDGHTLKEVLRAEAPLPADRALELLRDVARGVAVAHEAGLIHRDLKPANVLITARGEVKITDFGIARGVAEAGLTEPGQVWGTSHYIAPEQAMGRALTPATDIYALGVMLFEMLTGSLPYPGSDPVAVAIAHVQRPVPSVRAVEPEVPMGVDRLVQRMMAKAPTERPQDGQALVALLNRYLYGSASETVLRPALQLDDRAGTAPPDDRARIPFRPPLGLLAAFVGLCLTVALVGVLATGGVDAIGGASDGSPEPQVARTPAPSRPLPTFTAAAPATPPATATATAAPTATAPLPLAGPRVGNGPDARAAYVDRPIQIDGNLAEWDVSGLVPVDSPTFGRERWRGPADLSGSASFAWDDTFLYLAINRTDDEHLQSRVGFELYRDDSVELWLDADLLGDLNDAGINADDFQFAFSAGDFGTLRPEGVVYFPDRDERRHRNLQVRAEPLPNGYTLEARIPWAMLGVEPRANQLFGYAVVLNDNDSPPSDEPQTQVTTSLESPYQKPLTFGNLVLAP